MQIENPLRRIIIDNLLLYLLRGIFRNYLASIITFGKNIYVSCKVLPVNSSKFFSV
jgi:hypothetical protein